MVGASVGVILLRAEGVFTNARLFKTFSDTGMRSVENIEEEIVFLEAGFTIEAIGNRGRSIYKTNKQWQ